MTLEVGNTNPKIKNSIIQNILVNKKPLYQNIILTTGAIESKTIKVNITDNFLSLSTACIDANVSGCQNDLTQLLSLKIK